MTEVLATDDLDVARQRGAGVLREGLLAVAPTDTVYGLFADAFSMEATQRLMQARGTGRDRPPPVFVRSPRQLSGLVRYTSEQAERLIAAFWPGPLTIVFEANEGLAWDLGDSLGTVAVRMPAEELVYELVAEVGPLACTAACPAGGTPPRTVSEARDQLGDAAELYLDGGGRPGGASTVVDCSRGGAEVLRAGAVSADDVFKVATGAVDWGRPTGASEEPVEGGTEDTVALEPEDTMALEPGQAPDSDGAPDPGGRES